MIITSWKQSSDEVMEKLKEASIIISTGVTELSRGGVDEVTMDGI